jgi:YbbR domain-containing protein
MLKTITENWVLKLLSLVLALILWFFVMGEQKLERSYAVPLELKNMPAGMMVANEIPSHIEVRIAGPRTLLMNLQTEDIGISVNLKDLQPGLTTFKRLEENVDLPGPLKVTRVSPSYVDIKLERIRSRLVPVEVTVTGEPADGYRVGKIRVNPEKVMVEGAESEIAGIDTVPTEAVDVTGASADIVTAVPLNFLGKFSHLKGETIAEVQLAIQRRL